MTSQETIQIPILPFNMVNAHLIKTDKGSILVDTGIPGSERKIERVLHKHGLSFKDIKLIVVTHAHTDHAGSAAQQGAAIDLTHHLPLLGHGAPKRQRRNVRTSSTQRSGRLSQMLCGMPS